MNFVAVYLVSYPQPPFFLLGILLPYIFVLACIGIVLGYIFERKVEGRFMIIGSAAYWVLAFLFVFYYGSAAAFWSTFLVLFADITYAVRYIAGKRKKQPLC